jgi:hypothetical protein
MVLMYSQWGVQGSIMLVFVIIGSGP